MLFTLDLWGAMNRITANTDPDLLEVGPGGGFFFLLAPSLEDNIILGGRGYPGKEEDSNPPPIRSAARDRRRNSRGMTFKCNAQISEFFVWGATTQFKMW